MRRAMRRRTVSAGIRKVVTGTHAYKSEDAPKRLLIDFTDLGDASFLGDQLMLRSAARRIELNQCRRRCHYASGPDKLAIQL
jgi:hypothetical protein